MIIIPPVQTNPANCLYCERPEKPGSTIFTSNHQLKKYVNNSSIH